MKRILVPTDFSETAFNALAYAIGLSNDIGGEVVVVHAYGTPSTGSAVMMNIHDILLENANQELQQLEAKVKKLDIQPKNGIVYKPIESSIAGALNAITDSDVDELVVMGTDGEVTAAERYFGSHTNETAKTVDVPLLAVPAHQTYHGINRILVASDGKAVSYGPSLAYLCDFAKAAEAKIDIVAVLKSGSDGKAKSNTKLKDGLAQLLNSEVGHNLIIHEKTHQALHEVSRENASDVLVLFQRKHGFFEALFGNSVTKKMVNAAKLPILVLRG